VNGLANVVDVAAGEFFSAAVTADGAVWTWGNSNFGELGRGQRCQRDPVRAAIAGVVAISAGARHVLALKGDGSVWAWATISPASSAMAHTANRSSPSR
jgi:alpha-tubulin suppressor-like RCC1 family protein